MHSLGEKAYDLSMDLQKELDYVRNSMSSMMDELISVKSTVRVMNDTLNIFRPSREGMNESFEHRIVRRLDLLASKVNGLVKGDKNG